MEREDVGIVHRRLCFQFIDMVYTTAGDSERCWQVFQWCVTGDTFWEVYLSLWVMCKMKNDNISASLHLPVSSLTSDTVSLSLSLSGVQALPSLAYHVCITCPSASRMRHVWGLKIKDETDGCKEKREWDWWLGVRTWRGKEGGLAFLKQQLQESNRSIH